jgi:hypothetical protein
MAQKTRLPASSGFDALKWRCIGPSRGGRVVAVSGDPVNKMVSAKSTDLIYTDRLPRRLRRSSSAASI